MKERKADDFPSGLRHLSPSQHQINQISPLKQHALCSTQRRTANVSDSTRCSLKRDGEPFTTTFAILDRFL